MEHSGSSEIRLLLSLTGQDWLSPSVLLEAFEARSARQASAVALRLANGSGSDAGMLL